MKEKKNKWSNKLLMGLLGVLGFSTSFVLMACYAPVPNDYRDVTELPDEFTTLDSAEVTAENVEATPAEVVETPTEEASTLD